MKRRVGIFRGCWKEGTKLARQLIGKTRRSRSGELNRKITGNVRGEAFISCYGGFSSLQQFQRRAVEIHKKESGFAC